MLLEGYDVVHKPTLQKQSLHNESVETLQCSACEVNCDLVVANASVFSYYCGAASLFQVCRFFFLYFVRGCWCGDLGGFREKDVKIMPAEVVRLGVPQSTHIMVTLKCSFDERSKHQLCRPHVFPFALVVSQ